MKLHRFYQAIDFAKGKHVTLNNDAANHVSRVLRLKIGNTICLFNGRNQESLATIHDITKKSVEVILEEINDNSKESTFQLTLVQGLSKGERFDFVVQKAVELGVTCMIPILTERNVVKLDLKRQQKKIDHWQAIIENASAQCGRNQLMTISPITALSDYLQQVDNEQHFFLSPDAKQSISDLPSCLKSATFYIGPEGGFSETDIEMMTQANVLPLGLGPRVLRTETAGITISAIAQAKWGDL